MTLSLQGRHKKAAHAVKKLYENLLNASIDPACIAEYRTLESYLNLPTVDLSFEALSNRFHEHAKLSFLSFKEHHLLPTVTTQDLPSHEPFLPIDIFLDNIQEILRAT